MDRRTILALVLTVALFFVSGIFASHYADALRAHHLFTSPWGMALYVLVVIVSVIAAPLSSFPLLPVAVTLWGSLATALLSIGAWTIGGIGAYMIALHVGRPVIARYTNIERANAVAAILVGRDSFWNIVLLRMVLPVDVLSYALGLFVPMPLMRFVTTTLIGVAPFAFVFAYATSWSWIAQIIVLAVMSIILITTYRRLRLLRRSATIDEGF